MDRSAQKIDWIGCVKEDFRPVTNHLMTDVGAFFLNCGPFPFPLLLHLLTYRLLTYSHPFSHLLPAFPFPRFTLLPSLLPFPSPPFLLSTLPFSSSPRPAFSPVPPFLPLPSVLPVPPSPPFRSRLSTSNLVHLP